MEQEEIIAQAERIIRESRSAMRAVGPLAEARELVRSTAGERSAFYKGLLAVDQDWSADPVPIEVDRR